MSETEQSLPTKNPSPEQNEATSSAPETVDDMGNKKLSNKELKELKKREKAAKRSAKKQESGITIEQQQKQAQQKRDRKNQLLEQQLQQQREEQKKREDKEKQSKQNLKKSTLFGHLETTEERRATILALTSAISSPKASRITAAGLMVPSVASALSGSQVLTSSSLGSSVMTSSAPTSLSSNGTAAPSGTSGGSSGSPSSGNQQENPANNEMAKAFAAMTLETDEMSIVPGITSVIPHAIAQSFDSPQLVSAVKELLLNKDYIHPAITLLTSQIANYKIVGSIPRCIAMLEAFQIVVKDYQTPAGTTLSRNLTNYLSHQIDILKKARPLSVTMGNAIRWLKQEISLIDPSMPDKNAKQDLCEKIAQFAREKIELADQLIIGTASHHVENGTTIVTYGSSKVLTDLLLYNAVKLQKDFKVIVVDSRPLFEGRKMADLLRSHGVNVMYALITSLDDIFHMNVDYVFLGAHSILSNGFLYSRVGTAMLAMSAKRRNIPVLVCCESLKFSQRVQLDSVTFNELADPDDLISIDAKNSNGRHGVRGSLLNQFIKERTEESKKTIQENKPNGKGSTTASAARTTSNSENNENSDKNILDGWQDIPCLNIVNILYDLTPPEYIKKIITEFGALPPSSVPVILREYKSSA